MPDKKRKRTSIGRKQSTLFEKFFTPPKLALKLVAYLHSRIDLRKFETIVDCCCGATGSFVNAIDEVVHHPNVVAYDVHLSKKSKTPSHVKEQDFLTSDNPKVNPKTTLVISNVPFGVSGRTAAKFIQKAHEFADHIAFLLPISFLKPSFIKRFVPSNLHVVYSKTLRGCKFLDKNEGDDSDDECICDCPSCKKKKEKYVTVNCAFIYFQRREYPRIDKKREAVTCNPFFKLLDKSVMENRKKADIRVRGSGANAGKCFAKGDPDFLVDSERSDDYFVELVRGVRSHRTKICKHINNYDFTFLNTVPNVKYLSKSQIVKALNWITTLVRLK